MIQIELLVGIFLVVLGASVMIQSDFWIHYAKTLINHPVHIVPLGVVTLLYGLAILLWHPKWGWEPSVIVTLIGWITTIKGSLLLLFPKQMVSFYPMKMINPLFLKIEGFMVILLGAFVIYFVYY